MTVVVIVGVLSALAIPTFSDYIYKSRTTEATEFLGVIRLREEAYRSEFGTYCPTVAKGKNQADLAELASPAAFVPDPSKNKRDTTMFVATPEWLQLGATPSGPVRFGYGVVAGDPGQIPKKLGFEARPDFWWVARALSDLDGDGTYAVFETYSASKGIAIFNLDTAELIAKGWE